MVFPWFYILLLNHHCQKWCAELQDLWAGQVSRLTLSLVHESSGWRKANSATVHRLKSGWYLCCSLFHNWRVCCGEQQCCSDYLTGLSCIFLICRCRAVALPSSGACELSYRSGCPRALGVEGWLYRAVCSLLASIWWALKAAGPALGSCTWGWTAPALPAILCLYRSCAALAETLLMQWEWEHSSPWSTWSCVGCWSELVPLLVPFPKHSGWLWCSELRMELLVSWEQWGMQRDVFPWSC